MCVNSKIKAIWIIGQRKAFYRQRIPESSCAVKETVGIDILVASWNGDKKSYNTICQNNYTIQYYLLDLAWEKGNGTSWASPDGNLSK